MDKKAFDLFQTSVQWVWDDGKRKEAGRSHGGGLHHEQGLWIGGRIVDKIKAKWGSRRTEMAVVCPTSCCLGGHIVIANGDQFVVNTEDWDAGEYVTSVEHCVDEKDQVHSIVQRAMDLVGIDADEANRLFDGGNTAEDIVDFAEDVAANYGYKLEVL